MDIGDADKHYRRFGLIGFTCQTQVYKACLTRGDHTLRFNRFKRRIQVTLTGRIRLMLLLVALNSVGTVSMLGQSIVTGGIPGIVTDPSGAVIANAALTLRNTDTGESATATSSTSSASVFALLKPGDYTLSASKEGFKTSTRKIAVTLGTTVSVNVTLEIGSSEDDSACRSASPQHEMRST